jgi:hypothetical protein
MAAVHGARHVSSKKPESRRLQKLVRGHTKSGSDAAKIWARLLKHCLDPSPARCRHPASPLTSNRRPIRLSALFEPPQGVARLNLQERKTLSEAVMNHWRDTMVDRPEPDGAAYLAGWTVAGVAVIATIVAVWVLGI